MEVDDDAAANRFLSEEALAREPHSLRALAPLLQVRRPWRSASGVQTPLVCRYQTSFGLPEAHRTGKASLSPS
jgi:hypothetical protein